MIQLNVSPFFWKNKINITVDLFRSKEIEEYDRLGFPWRIF